MSWSYRTGSPRPAHLSLGSETLVNCSAAWRNKEDLKIQPRIPSFSFRTIKRGAPTVWLLLRHLPLLLCLFSDSLLLLQRGRAAWPGTYHSSATGWFVLLREERRFPSRRFSLPPSPAGLPSMGWSEVEEKFQREVGGGVQWRRAAF